MLRAARPGATPPAERAAVVGVCHRQVFGSVLRGCAQPGGVGHCFPPAGWQPSVFGSVGARIHHDKR
eukprot:5317607-Lingulodinium_polyedra.AAC.1